jgi:Tfp pilus assembly protein PilV
MGEQQRQPKRLDAMNERDESGSTVIEVLIAALIFSLGAFAVFGVVRQLASNSALAAAASQGDATIDHLTSALTSDASTALALFLPDDDRCTGASGKTLEIYYEDNGGTSQTITYRDDGSGTVTRSSVSNGATTTFSNASLLVRCATATSIAALDNLAANLPNVAVHDYPVNFGTDANGLEQTGGNRLIIARIASTATRAGREVHLLAGSVPTGFTVIGPQWHAVVYREDHTRRFLFGLGQTSWLRIMAEVDVSYDDWRTRAVWCNFEALEVYGGQPRFNKDDVPVYAGATDSDPPTRTAVPDLYPETLLEYCRNHFSPDPPGSLGGTWGTPAPFPTPDDQVVAIPPWWIWQNCGPSMSCSAGTQPPATCDPERPGSCTVTVPPVPPAGWPAWCQAWSPPTWGAPSFGQPCPAATPPPAPAPSPPPPSSAPSTNSATWTIVYDGEPSGAIHIFSGGSCNSAVWGGICVDNGDGTSYDIIDASGQTAAAVWYTSSTGNVQALWSSDSCAGDGLNINWNGPAGNGILYALDRGPGTSSASIGAGGPTQIALDNPYGQGTSACTGTLTLSDQ